MPEAPTPPRAPREQPPLESLIGAVAAATGASRAALAAARKLKACCVARQGAGLPLDRLFAGRADELAAALSISEVSAYRAVARGRHEAQRWMVVMDSE